MANASDAIKKHEENRQGDSLRAQDVAGECISILSIDQVGQSEKFKDKDGNPSLYLILDIRRPEGAEWVERKLLVGSKVLVPIIQDYFDQPDAEPLDVVLYQGDDVYSGAPATTWGMRDWPTRAAQREAVAAASAESLPF